MQKRAQTTAAKGSGCSPAVTAMAGAESIPHVKMSGGRGKAPRTGVPMLYTHWVLDFPGPFICSVPESYCIELL